MDGIVLSLVGVFVQEWVRETPLDRDRSLYDEEWAVHILLECFLVHTLSLRLHQTSRMGSMATNDGFHT